VNGSRQDTRVDDGASSPEALRRLRRGATRILVTASILFAPVPFSELFVVGLVPLWCTAVYFARDIPVALQGSAAGDVPIAAAMLAAHLIVDGGLLYVIATIISRLLFALFPIRVAVFVVGMLCTAEAIASFFPLYVFAGEHDTQFLTLWRVAQQFVMGR
jgi:hypothetical protein